MHWKKFLFTGAYTGYFPIASGTAGTLLSMALYSLEYFIAGEKSWLINLAIVAVMIYPSIRLCDAGEKFFGEKDPSEVVLDEVIGYRVSVLFYPFNWKITIMAFFIFRIFDILKPFPAKRLEKLSGGLGIVIDDFITGIYTNLLLLIIVLISYFSGCPVYN